MTWFGRLLKASSPEGKWWGGVTGWRPRDDLRRVAHEAEGPCGLTGSATSGGREAYPRIPAEAEASVEFVIGVFAQRGYEEAWPSSC